MVGNYVQSMRLFQMRLREAMKREKLTQEQLAEKAGVSQSGISEYLNGQRSPKIKTIRIMADCLGVDPTWLMGVDKETESTQLLDMFYRLDTADRNRVTGYIEALLSSDKYKGQQEAPNSPHNPF